MSVVVVVPSRGRPEAALETVQAIRDTAHLVSTNVIVAVDADDPELPGYRAMRFGTVHRAEVSLVVLEPSETGDLVRATNTVSMRVAREDPACVIGNLGDDHRPRTPGWDKLVAEALATPGIAYGDDLLQHEALPTAPFISASIVLALGWYALPTCRHLFIDDAWKSIGEGIGALRYLPDMVIEHMHPAAGKAEWDEGYRRANGDQATARDHRAFEHWRRTWREADLENIRRGLEAAA